MLSFPVTVVKHRLWISRPQRPIASDRALPTGCRPAGNLPEPAIEEAVISAESDVTEGASGRRSGGDPTGGWPAHRDLVQLRDTVEVVTGPDQRTMLFEQTGGNYMFLSPGMAAMVPDLRSGRPYEQLRDQLAARSRVEPDRVDAVLRPVLVELARASLLTEAPDEKPAVVDRLARSNVKMPIYRFPLATERADRLFEAIARPLRSRLGARILGALGCLAVIGVVLAVVAVATRIKLVPELGQIWIIYVITIVGILCHETAHGVVCRYYGVPPREVGVGLWLYFLPIAFVDRSESVRLSARWPRVAILLAGPTVDGLFMGTSALVLLTSDRQSALLSLLVLFQLLGFVANLNPMLPTDGQQAFENWSGQLNLRNRSLTFMLHRVLRRPLPTALVFTSQRQRAFYWSYGVVCALYAALLLALSIRFFTVVTVAILR